MILLGGAAWTTVKTYKGRGASSFLILAFATLVIILDHGDPLVDSHRHRTRTCQDCRPHSRTGEHVNRRNHQ